MREFRDISAFLRFAADIPARIRKAELVSIELGAEIIKKEAQEEIGHYQRENMGPFREWDELADSTKRDRVSAGFPENNPLLRTGELKESIGVAIVGREAAVGSNSPIAEYQELGTHAPGSMAGDEFYHVPPRPFLGTAGFRKGAVVADVLGNRVVWALRGLPDRND